MTDPNTQPTDTPKPGVLRRNLARHRAGLALVLGFGGLVNVLALSAPLFALQVYDRVLSSRSEETLLVLCALLAIALAGMGAVDHFRRRILAHIGVSVANGLAAHVRHAQMTGGPAKSQLHHKLDHLHHACASPAVAALLDLPWTPIFLLVLFLFHPTLGWWAVILAGLSLAYLGWSWARITPPALATADAPATPTPTIYGLHKFSLRAAEARTNAQTNADGAARSAALMGTLRGLAQSLTIALAAYLVLQGALTPGAILASTVLLARFLAPFDHLGAGLPALRMGWVALRALRDLPDLPQSTTKPAKARLSVAALGALNRTTGQAYLQGVNFALDPGQTLGVIGPSGAGKSALLAHLSGLLPGHMGTITPRPTPDHTLYVPQWVDLTGQSIADVVSGGHPNPDQARIWHAMDQMGLSESMRQWPEPLAHVITSTDLPAGQTRALAMARLAYQRPNIALLDEPFAGLDADLRARLQELLDGLRQQGTITIIATQQPSALSHADHLLVLGAGQQKAFGPAAQILAATTKNVAHLGPVTLKRQHS